MFYDTAKNDHGLPYTKSRFFHFITVFGFTP